MFFFALSLLGKDSTSTRAYIRRLQIAGLADLLCESVVV